MNVINGRPEVDDTVAFPSQRPNGGLALQIGVVEELRPEKGALRVKPVYSTTRAALNKDGTYKSKEVPADLCVIIDRRGHNADEPA